MINRVVVFFARGDLKKAEKQLADCLTVAEGLLPLIEETPQLRMGAFSCAMEVRVVLIAWWWRRCLCLLLLLLPCRAVDL